ncbi:MAG: hypothetical protein IJ308_02415 [Clostridia bacterium]|nr:hypothetical protein [Clostridia bacterium]
MGKKKSVVLMILITIVMVALCLLTAFPTIYVSSLNIWNPAIMQFDLGMDLGGNVYAWDWERKEMVPVARQGDEGVYYVGGGYSTYYYPNGVISEAEYKTDVQFLTGDELKEAEAKYVKYNGLYLSTDSEDGVLEEDVNGALVGTKEDGSEVKYSIKESFKTAFAAATEEICARYAAKGYEDYLVARVDDYALRVEIPASQVSENVTARNSAEQAFNIFLMTGEMNFKTNGALVDEMKDEDVTIKDIVKSIAVKTKYDYAYIEIKLTSKGIQMLNTFKSSSSSDTSATLDLCLGDQALINLDSDDFDGDVIKYTAAEDEDKHYVDTMGIVLKSAYENGGFDVSFTCGDIYAFAPRYNNNSLYFAFGAVLAVMIGLIVFGVVKFGKFGVVNVYATVSYFIITALCFAFISKGVFVVTLGSFMIYLLGLVLTNVFQMYIYNAIKTEFNLGKTVESSVKGGYKKTLWNVVDVYAVLVLASLALLIGAAGLQTLACQALICVIAAAFINLVWARVINFIFLSACKNKYKYFRFVREDDDDE